MCVGTAWQWWKRNAHCTLLPCAQQLPSAPNAALTAWAHLLKCLLAATILAY